MPVPGHAGLFRLQFLGWWLWYTPGIFLTASRDLPGQPLRIVIERSRALAESAKVLFADLGSLYPLGTAGAAITGFKSVCLNSWPLFLETGSVAVQDDSAVSRP